MDNRATIAELMRKMILYSKDVRHDINHLMKVWTYAKTIGELERLDSETQYMLEVVAIIHDIACPTCREKYGNAAPRLQEQESEPLVRAFLADSGMTQEQIDRAAFIVSHHHTLDAVDAIDFQILVEADYLVNADESAYPREANEKFLAKHIKTNAGAQLLRAIFLS